SGTGGGFCEREGRRSALRGLCFTLPSRLGGGHGNQHSFGGPWAVLLDRAKRKMDRRRYAGPAGARNGEDEHATRRPDRVDSAEGRLGDHRSSGQRRTSHCRLKMLRTSGRRPTASFPTVKLLSSRARY